MDEIETTQIAASAYAAEPDETATMRPVFTCDQTNLRATLRRDLAVKHDVAVAVKTAVTWSA